MAAEIQTARAHRQLYECVKNIVKSNVDLSSWCQMTQNLLDKCTVTSTAEKSQSEAFASSSETNLSEETQQMNELFNSNVERKRYEHGFVTIGCCGFPNVGKSSLLNSLNGRKVVSVSRTPGHTKHLQTIFLTKSVRLCDCPGLVFPSLVSKPLQILAGIYPVAQLQEPYSAIRYLAERIPVIQILKLKHPAQENTNLDAQQQQQQGFI
jgi:ribosome biogenesis GTPase A